MRSAAEFFAEACNLAFARGGECVSGSYTNYLTKLEFRCADGHAFMAPLAQIRRGSWCPDCRYPTEALVRQFFECWHPGHKFRQCSPSWARSAEHGICKLDGYNEELKIAFEYHGAQHSRPVDFFHSKRSLEKQKARDAFIRDACGKEGVLLIEISSVEVKEVDLFIAHVQAAIEAAIGRALPEETVSGFKALPFRTSKLAEMRAIAASHGGRCLSTKYVTVHDKLHWQCAAGHEWQARAANIKNKGYWCPVCAGWAEAQASAQAQLLELQAIAKTKGGVLLTPEYINNKMKLSVVCAQGHNWVTDVSSLKRDHWCPVCAGRRLQNPIQELHQLAEERGGKYLGVAYKNNRERQPFLCGSGHTFELKPINLKHHGMWCPACLRQS